MRAVLQAEVPLDMEPQPIIAHKKRTGQVQVTAEQDDMGSILGVQVGLRVAKMRYCPSGHLNHSARTMPGPQRTIRCFTR
jgi:hypothetical protein